jgi:hypothetical protein
MPQLLEHLDAIARKKGRDVLCLDFPIQEDDDNPFAIYEIDWDEWPVRQEVIAWLDKNNIEWCACANVASDSFSGGYTGRIYLDVPYDVENPVYQKLAAYLETPEGEMKISGVRFLFLRLERAMENAHHDEPGYWESRAENF